MEIEFWFCFVDVMLIRGGLQVISINENIVYFSKKKNIESLGDKSAMDLGSKYSRQ